MIQGFANIDSEIPEEKDSDAEEKLLERQTTLKVLHRDSSWKLASRIMSTLSVFIYQGTVFYAQKVLADEIFECHEDGGCR
jgi:hypothetical protein